MPLLAPARVKSVNDRSMDIFPNNPSMRISYYCRAMAEELGMDSQFLDQIFYASPMHDVGKIAIPDSILLKPGPLTLEERTVMEQHTTIGHEILAGSDAELLQLASRLALTHHERYDGDGYPGRLRGDEIPIEGRIAAVADVFDALTMSRVYTRLSRSARRST